MVGGVKEGFTTRGTGADVALWRAASVTLISYCHVPTVESVPVDIDDVKLPQTNGDPSGENVEYPGGS